MALEIGSLDITYGAESGSVPWNMRDGGLLQTQDGVRGLSQTTSSAAAAEPSVAGLRDRLLREARQERIRCLQVARASERWRADDGGAASPTTAATSDAALQTDPVLINSSASGGPVDASMADVWSQNDEDNQREAIRIIQSLSQRACDTSSSDRRIAELEEMLNKEKKSRLDLEATVSKEKEAKAALQEQVLCLEQELDGKENTLQASERALERGMPQDALQITEHGLGTRPMQTMPDMGSVRQTMPNMGRSPQAALGNSSFRSPSPFNPTGSFGNQRMRPVDGRNRSMSPNAMRMAASEEASLLAARRQLLERDQQMGQTMGARDPQLSQLLRELRQSQDAPISGFDQGSAGNGWTSPRFRDMNQTTPSLNFGMHRR